MFEDLRGRFVGDADTFEAVEFCEPADERGKPFPGTSETVLGAFATEIEALDVARTAWRAYRAASNDDVMWWLVRKKGEPFAWWIADGHSDVERVLDLRTNRLVEAR